MPDDVTPKSIWEREIVLPKYARYIDRGLLLFLSLWFAYLAGEALMSGRLAENARAMGLHPAFGYLFWVLLTLAGAEFLWAATLKERTWALSLAGMLAGPGIRLTNLMRPEKDWPFLMLFCVGLMIFPLGIILVGRHAPAPAPQE